MISPPSTGNTVNTQVDTRIFQFPPSNQVKQEDFMPCLQDGYSISPMAISPNMSTLNTPRGSITSMRSQQSPMDQNPPPPQTHHPQSNPGVDPIMSSYDAFEAAFVYPCSSQNYPSPPGSPIVSSTTNFQPYDDYFTIPQVRRFFMLFENRLFRVPNDSISGSRNSAEYYFCQPKFSLDNLHIHSGSHRILCQLWHLSWNARQLRQRRSRYGQFSRHWQLHLFMARLRRGICHAENAGGTYQWKSHGQQKRMRRISLHVERLFKKVQGF